MRKKENENTNILFVSLFIGIMLIFMLGTVVYVTSQITNCSSVKKARNICYEVKIVDKRSIAV